MQKIDVLNIKAEKVGDIELNENVFGVEINEIVVHTALVNYLANQRQGTQSTKTRAEVRGGGRKPWKQKGTGRARQGSIRAPQWIKGGIALGPKPRKYTYKINKKVRQLAIKSVLSSKVLESKLIVLDKIDFKNYKTKQMVGVLNKLNTNNALVVMEGKNENVMAATKNIMNVKAVYTNSINIFDLLKYNTLIMTVDAVKKVEEVCG